LTLPSVIKFTMTFLADPEEVCYPLIKNSLIGEMSTLLSISTEANFTLSFCPYAHCSC
jgi:hypothetical protein